MCDFAAAKQPDFAFAFQPAPTWTIGGPRSGCGSSTAIRTRRSISAFRTGGVACACWAPTPALSGSPRTAVANPSRVRERTRIPSTRFPQVPSRASRWPVVTGIAGRRGCFPGAISGGEEEQLRTGCPCPARPQRGVSAAFCARLPGWCCSTWRSVKRRQAGDKLLGSCLTNCWRQTRSKFRNPHEAGSGEAGHQESGAGDQHRSGANRVGGWPSHGVPQGIDISLLQADAEQTGHGRHRPTRVRAGCLGPVTTENAPPLRHVLPQ